MQLWRGKALPSTVLHDYLRVSLLHCSEPEKECEILVIYILFQLCLSLATGK